MYVSLNFLIRGYQIFLYKYHQHALVIHKHYVDVADYLHQIEQEYGIANELNGEQFKLHDTFVVRERAWLTMNNIIVIALNELEFSDYIIQKGQQEHSTFSTLLVNPIGLLI